ncbi:MAG TPA: type VI secretion system-associated FHA domain protein [Polyangiaceae bacterium]|nr:type VI secretion system-associated FHA domain protein [Polyangiaceae bacterium]
MALAFILSGSPIELTRHRFTSLPIRLGRNELNDCPIVHPLVSNFHARIDDVGGKLCVEDLGSKNGVFVPQQGVDTPLRIPPNQPHDLQASGFEFFLSVGVKITIRFETHNNPLDDRLAKSFAGSVLGNREALLGALPPAAAQASAVGNPWGGQSAAPARAMSTQFFTDLRPEALALQGLRELAQSLVPGASLESTGEVARFITKVHDALEAFLRSAIPLREGYTQFVASLDLSRNSRRGAARSPAAAAVEAAHSPEALAQALLNPAEGSFDAPRALEGIFADLMMHQMALLDGMMRGVRALLEELSPERIQGQAGSHLFGQHKANWEAYTRRFEELNEERQTFAVVFGPEFASAYRRYHQEGGEGRVPTGV